MKKTGVLFIILIVFFSCNLDSLKEGNKNSIKVDKLIGQVQKGPFNNGTIVTISELNEDLGQTGRVFKSEIKNNIGEFEISNITLESPYVIVEANGFYFNECTGENSEAPLILNAIANIEDQTTLNINLLSHLEKDRVIKLVGEGLSFYDAKSQAQNEILALFEMNEANEEVISEHMDITRDGEANAKLLAVSAIFQVGNSTSCLSKLLADVKTDLYDNGLVDEEAIKYKLLSHAFLLSSNKIKENLEEKYDEEEVETSIPSFEPYIDQFLQSSSQKVFSHVRYPDSTFFGKNVLSENVDTIFYGETYSLGANLIPEIKCKIVVDGIGFTTQCGAGSPYNCSSTASLGHFVFESFPGVESMSVKVHAESWEPDEFGVSHFNIDYYEGVEEFVKMGSKELVAAYKDYSFLYEIPKVGQYGENILRMEGDTLALNPDVKYCFEIEAHNELELYSVINIGPFNESAVNILSEDLLNFGLNAYSGGARLFIQPRKLKGKCTASIIFTGHGATEINGHVSIIRGSSKIGIKNFNKVVVTW